MKKEDFKFLAQLLMKYHSMGTKEAFRELMNIDFIKNNYAKSTLFNYIGGTKAFLREGKMYKGMSKNLAKELEKYKKENAPTGLYIERVKEETYTDIIDKIKELKKKKEALEEDFYKQINYLKEKYIMAQKILDKLIEEEKAKKDLLLEKEAKE